MNEGFVEIKILEKKRMRFVNWMLHDDIPCGINNEDMLEEVRIF